MASQAVSSKIHCTLSANQKRDSDFNVYEKRVQSRKNYLIRSSHLIDSLRPFLLLTNQNAWFISTFCTELRLFCTVELYFSANQNREIFAYILLETKGYCVNICVNIIR